MQLTGLHHVTAITARASQNVSFYTQVLGMRLVKKTVNQDDVSAYHLFYADAVGSPGTDLTFFDWPHVVQNRNGVGSIAPVFLRVSGIEALSWWERRLADSGIDHQGIRQEDGRSQLRFSDPEGLDLVLVDDQGAPGGILWDRGPVPPEMGIRGLHAVNLMVRDPAPIAAVLTQVLGFQSLGELSDGGGPAQARLGFSMGPGGPGAEVYVDASPTGFPARTGAGGVHHVAFRTPDAGEQLAWRERIDGAGLNVTPVIDRFYFKSIYFRVPEGILFEIATDGPGFATDEDVETLGERLALPPFLEPQRAIIEAQLHPLETP